MWQTTVRQALRLALPLGTKVIVGQGQLEKRVSWAQAMASTPPFFGSLHGGELVILSLQTIQRLDNEFTFGRMIADMVGLGIAGIAYEGTAGEEAVALATKSHLPLLQLPDGSNDAQAAQAIQRLITQTGSQQSVRAQELAQHLSAVCETCPGPEAFLAALTQLTGHAAILQDQHKKVCISPPEGRARYPERRIRRWAADGIASLKAAHSLEPVHSQIAGIKDWAGWQAPVTVGHHIVTAIALADKRPALDEFSQLAVSQAALAWSQRLEEERSAVLARSNVREEFIRQLAARSRNAQGTIFRLARLLDYALEEEQWAIVFATTVSDHSTGPQWQSVEQIALRCAEEKGWNMLSGCVSNRLILLGHSPEAPGVTAIRQLAEETRNTATHHMTTPLFCGIGRSQVGVEGLYSALRQAEESLDWGRRLFSSAGGVLTANDVAMYRLLYDLRGSQEAYGFYRATLGPLAQYDQKHGTELLPSLETYLRYHGNISQAAKALHVHRNTLIYRLKRVGEISGMDLDEAETRLALQIALRLSYLL
ncbi:MAG: hypothetical protein GXP41_01770 [Chloroflexi bacterium]|nr:hypothetical protein [Chloroflexota bacterium]